MNRGPVGLTIFTFIIGIIAIYLGMGIMNVGDNVSDLGGAFGNNYQLFRDVRYRH